MIFLKPADLVPFTKKLSRRTVFSGKNCCSSFRVPDLFKFLIFGIAKITSELNELEGGWIVNCTMYFVLTDHVKSIFTTEKLEVTKGGYMTSKHKNSKYFGAIMSHDKKSLINTGRKIFENTYWFLIF